MTRWTPSHTNGWYPQLSPSGRYVAFGNWNVWIVDTTDWTVRDLGPGWAAGWLTLAGIEYVGITYCQSRPDDPPGDWRQQKRRWVRTVATDTWAVTEQTEIPPDGSPVLCAGESIIGYDYDLTQPGSSWTYLRWRIDADGIARGGPVALASTEPLLGQPALSDDGRALVVGESVHWQSRIFDLDSGACISAPPFGLGAPRLRVVEGRVTVTYNAVGGPWVSVDGVARVIPHATVKAQEGCGDYDPASGWAWTFAWQDDQRQYYAVGRPATEQAGICLPMPGLGLQARLRPEGWTVCGYGDDGQLVVYAGVPIDTARVDVESLIQMPPVKALPDFPPIPAALVGMKLWIGVDQTRGYIAAGNACWSAVDPKYGG